MQASEFAPSLQWTLDTVRMGGLRKQNMLEAEPRLATFQAGIYPAFALFT